MSVLVDTSVWSLALRRKRANLNARERAIVMECRDIVVAGEACTIGVVCQETLSGISDEDVFEGVKQRLSFIEELSLGMEVFILAAEFYNRCRANGIVPGAVDMTICAAANWHNSAIFTTDPDFSRYARHLPIVLNESKSRD